MVVIHSLFAILYRKYHQISYIIWQKAVCWRRSMRIIDFSTAFFVLLKGKCCIVLLILQEILQIFTGVCSRSAVFFCFQL